MPFFFYKRFLQSDFKFRQYIIIQTENFIIFVFLGINISSNFQKISKTWKINDNCYVFWCHFFSRRDFCNRISNSESRSSKLHTKLLFTAKITLFKIWRTVKKIEKKCQKMLFLCEIWIFYVCFDEQLLILMFFCEKDITALFFGDFQWFWRFSGDYTVIW